MKKLSLICAALLIAGCGGSHTTTAPAPMPTPTVPPVAMLDAFFTAVSGVVSAMLDDAEASNIDAMAATAPEDSEPVPL